MIKIEEQEEGRRRRGGLFDGAEILIERPLGAEGQEEEEEDAEIMKTDSRALAIHHHTLSLSLSFTHTLSLSHTHTYDPDKNGANDSSIDMYNNDVGKRFMK
jgi:hypothetical protein